ncbi:hypothetical protein ACJIZ3_002484 [Penstemon smallii]|uniref:TPX2 C-terminal domain-containing protein n=1 Tax=Penstemon smallii TaxID=265156 RepID=A0ABD3U833_9LAMI
MENPNRKSAQKVLQKSMIKENTKPLEFKLHTQQRAARRAIFNSTVISNTQVEIKLCIIKQYKKQVEKVLKVIEEEEVRMLRKEMVPRAQLMPLFDRPFLPQRSTRPLTIPREPSFCLTTSKHYDCIS